MTRDYVCGLLRSEWDTCIILPFPQSSGNKMEGCVSESVRPEVRKHQREAVLSGHHGATVLRSSWQLW